MRHSSTRTAATIAVVAFAVGCGVDDSPKAPGNSNARSSAKARCAGQECRVRVVCKGEVQMRYGPAPVRVRTSRTALVTTIYADFAGSRNDVTIRC